MLAVYLMAEVSCERLLLLLLSQNSTPVQLIKQSQHPLLAPTMMSQRCTLTVTALLLIIHDATAFSIRAQRPTIRLPRAAASRLSARNDDDDDDDYFGEYADYDDLGSSDSNSGGFGVPSPFGRRDGLRLPESVSKSVLAGVLMLGIGLGVTLDSAINTDNRDLASRDAIDQAAPNSLLCANYGASALALDQRVFVSFNPFNVYVAQADVKPACVLRESNVVAVLEERKLLNDQEVRACKQNMNTWAFVGTLEDMPQLSCVYKSADAQNEFLLENPKLGIGEDVWDDEREQLAQGKTIKTALTSAQKELLKKQIAAEQAAAEATQE